MMTFSSFRELMDVIDTLHDGWVFFDADLSELEKARFLVLEGRESVDLEQVEIEGKKIPRVAHDQRMHGLLDVATLQDAIDLRRQAMPNATLAQFAEAIRHYVTEDDFLD